ALELAQCHAKLRTNPTTAEALETSMRKQGQPESAIAKVRLRRQRAGEQRAACAALPDELMRRRPWLHLQAALAGNSESMVAFARLDGATLADLVADPELYVQYRQHAYSLWRQAFERGSLNAVIAWHSAVNGPQFSPLLGVMPTEFHDPQRVQALLQRIADSSSAFEGIRPPPRPGADRSETPAELDAEAREWAERAFNRYLAGSPLLARSEMSQRRFASIVALLQDPATNITAITDSAEADAKN
ncbi:MAG: hypothetical protein R3F15_00005, partial [Lysobacterales bacterium]